MTHFKQIVTMALLMAILISATPISTFSVEESSSPATDTLTIDPEYLAEMEALGYTEAEVVELYEWSLKLMAADSMQEVDILMDEYNSLTNNSQTTKSSNDSGFYSSTGGTLILEHTGTSNPVSQIIYTKVVYLPTEQTLYYHVAMHSEGFLDYLKSELLAAGVSFITGKIAAQIALYLSLPKSATQWLVGTSVAISIWMLSNLDEWDLEDAIEQSKNSGGAGAVKLEFYYHISISFPQYMEYQNFEPWDGEYIIIPSDYDFIWHEGIFDYDESTCSHTHSLTYLSNDNDTHSVACQNCSEEITEDCTFNYNYIGNHYHELRCYYCGYLKLTLGCRYECQDNDDGTHTKSCTLCGNTYTENCNLAYIGDGTDKHTGECTICGFTIPSTSCSFAFKYNGDLTHTSACTLCSNSTNTSINCTMRYVYTGNVDGTNTHKYACAECDYSAFGSTACTYKNSDYCSFCGTHKNSVSQTNLKAIKLEE